MLERIQLCTCAKNWVLLQFQAFARVRMSAYVLARVRVCRLNQCIVSAVGLLGLSSDFLSYVSVRARTHVPTGVRACVYDTLSVRSCLPWRYAEGQDVGCERMQSMGAEDVCSAQEHEEGDLL